MNIPNSADNVLPQLVSCSISLWEATVFIISNRIKNIVMNCPNYRSSKEETIFFILTLVLFVSFMMIDVAMLWMKFTLLELFNSFYCFALWISLTRMIMIHHIWTIFRVFANWSALQVRWLPSPPSWNLCASRPPTICWKIGIRRDLHATKFVSWKWFVSLQAYILKCFWSSHISNPSGHVYITQSITCMRRSIFIHFSLKGRSVNDLFFSIVFVI